MSRRGDGPDSMSSVGHDGGADKRRSQLFLATAIITGLWGLVSLVTGDTLIALALLGIVVPGNLFLWRGGFSEPEDPYE